MFAENLVEDEGDDILELIPEEEIEEKDEGVNESFGDLKEYQSVFLV